MRQKVTVKLIPRIDLQAIANKLVKFVTYFLCLDESHCLNLQCVNVQSFLFIFLLCSFIEVAFLLN